MIYTRCFHESLRELSVNNDDNYIDEWVYAGGDTGRHLNYFNIRYCGKIDIPMSSSRCICSHPIVENCYIENILDNKLVVVGNCCIKKFLKNNNKNRTCGICRTSHKNRKDNM